VTFALIRRPEFPANLASRAPLRMCFALFIAAASIISGRATSVPRDLTEEGALFPEVLPLLLMISGSSESAGPLPTRETDSQK